MGPNLFKIGLQCISETKRYGGPHRMRFVIEIYFDGLTGKVNEVSLRIQPECGKIRITKNSEFGHISRSASFVDKCLKILWYQTSHDVMQEKKCHEF